MTHSQDDKKFNDKSSLHRFRTEIPNIIFDLGLDPFSLALYVYYKKVAGDNGACYQTKATIEKNTQMSPSTIKDRDRILSQPFEQLGGKSLIEITQRKDDNGNNLPTLITIEDIWPENFKILSTRFSSDGGVGRQKTEVGRQKTAEEEPIKKEPKNNNKDVVCPFLHRLILTDEHKIRLSKQYDWETLRIAVERVLAWEGRESDAAAIETVLKRPNEWIDKPDKQAAKAEAERLIEVIRPYDGKRINEMLIVVGKDYVEFSGGVSYYEVFKAEDPNFATLLGLKLEKLGLPKKS